MRQRKAKRQQLGLRHAASATLRSSARKFGGSLLVTAGKAGTDAELSSRLVANTGEAIGEASLTGEKEPNGTGTLEVAESGREEEPGEGMLAKRWTVPWSLSNGTVLLAAGLGLVWTTGSDRRRGEMDRCATKGDQIAALGVALPRLLHSRVGDSAQSLGALRNLQTCVLGEAVAAPLQTIAALGVAHGSSVVPFIRHLHT